MNKFNLFLILSLTFCLQVNAQKAPFKFGEVSSEDLKMTSYPGDTSASAVILFDYGCFKANTFMFTRTIRIKILKKEGYYWANHSYPTTTKAMIKGITTNLVNGKVIQEKLKNESIFSTRISENNYTMRIAMPGVRVGSVIDIEFGFEGIPGEWRFQEIIPVRYSELILEKSPVIKLRSNLFGTEKLEIVTPTRWVAKDIPSFKVEPYLNSEVNYLTKIEFDLLEYGTGYNSVQVTTSWDAVFKNLYRYDRFGLALNGGSLYLNSLAEYIEATGKTKIENLKLAFETIKSNVKWDENESLVTSSPNLGFVYKGKVGNSADINLILIQLLRKLNIEVIPVAFSTRKNGLISPFSPSQRKLNYVIAMATIDGKKYLLDATEPFMPYNLIPMRCLNYQGRTVEKEESKWVDLVTDKKHKVLVYSDLKLEENNKLQGNINIISTDYAALEFRKKYSTFNSVDEYLEDFRKDKIGLIINESQLNNIDSFYMPVNASFNVTIDNKFPEVDDEVYITPMIYDQLIENPFLMPERKYPVDFGYNSEKTVISIIRIPKNYTVSSLPAATSLALPENAATYKFDVVKIDSVIKMTSRYNINKTLFQTGEYIGLREFNNLIIKKHSEPIILKKK